MDNSLVSSPSIRKPMGHHLVPISVCLICGIDPNFDGNLLKDYPKNTHDSLHRIFDNKVPWRYSRVLRARSRYCCKIKKLCDSSYKTVFPGMGVQQAIIFAEDTFIPHMPGEIIEKLKAHDYLTKSEESRLMEIYEKRENQKKLATQKIEPHSLAWVRLGPHGIANLHA